MLPNCGPLDACLRAIGSRLARAHPAPVVRRWWRRVLQTGKRATLVGLISLLAPVGTARAGEPLPRYLQELRRPINAGDWTLQCDGGRNCQIIGVAKIPKNHVGVRAVVLISRGAAKGADTTLRLAFIDATGSTAVPPPNERWRLYARNMKKTPPPLRLPLGEMDASGAYPVKPQSAARIISAFRRWPASAIRQQGRRVATMPRGNLARLLRTMNRLQHPPRPRLTAAQSSQWLRPYHYTVLRSYAIETPTPTPHAITRACDRGPVINQPFVFRIGPEHRLWTVECPAAMKVFVQKANHEPVKFDVRDADRNIHPHGYAGFNTDNSLLELHVPTRGNSGCGRYLKFGFTGHGFAMIEDRRYERCRAVPHDFWPVVWRPTSWKYEEPTTDNTNDLPHAGVAQTVLPTKEHP